VLTHGAEATRQQRVVAIRGDNPFAPAVGHTGISRRALTAVLFVANERDSGVGIGSNYCSGIVLRSVVYDNQLEVLKRLGQAALNCAAYFPLPIVHGDDNAE
jgi:hypothetical protein